MPWSRFSDDFTDECYGLSDKAFRLHHEGIEKSNKYLLDCYLTERELRMCPSSEALPELLNTGFWERRGTGYQIIHHADVQRTREAVLKQAEAARKNGAKGGRPKGVKGKDWRDRSLAFGDKETQQVNNPVGSETYSQSHLQSNLVSHLQSERVNKTHSLTQTDWAGNKGVLEEPLKNESTQQSFNTSEDMGGAGWSGSFDDLPEGDVDMVTGEMPPPGVSRLCAESGCDSEPFGKRSWCFEHNQQRLKNVA